ncbi:MAG: membrane protein insertase YidC [Anaerolineae bacterium]|nr:membrane protein insertase YidC [Anaerolineae bacterium]
MPDFAAYVAPVLQWLYSLTGSYGWTLIIIGIGIRLLTWPLNLQQMRSSKQMAALNPQLEALRKKYKDDKEKLTQAQMELYREAGINPLGGCLPMIIQFPILIILYQGIVRLQGTPEFNAPFWWLPNLAHPEGVPPVWPFTQFYPTIPAAPLFIPILIVVMVITSLIQQQMMPMTSTDPQARSMASSMQLMTVMFAFIFISLPAGLTLYYVVQNLTGIALQYLWLGPGKLPLPSPPWLHDETPPRVSPNGAALVTEPTINSATANSSDMDEDEDPVAVPKRRTNVRNKKKRRSER